MNKSIYIDEQSKINYDVIFTNHIFSDDSKVLNRYTNNRNLLVVMSKTIDSLYGSKIKSYFNNHNADVNYLTIKTGELNKNFKNIIEILNAAQRCNLDRKGIMICIGGGILMDMVGFAASIYRRKIDYLRIPTTLIGQVDAGVGIKTGINFNDSKNFIGTFYAPIACINDSEFLTTLRAKEIKSGMSEILKMAIICNFRLFNLVEKNINNIFSTKFQSKHCLDISYQATYEMINELKPNFYEYCLERLVDFGHTFSPFIEAYSNYEISHGSAVALDIAISTEIAYLLNRIDIKDRNRILILFNKVGLKIYDERTFNPLLMWNSLKKIVYHRGGKLNLPIPTAIGTATFIYDLNSISLDILTSAIDNLRIMDNAIYNEMEKVINA